jgi:hypothetical protein
MEVAEDGPAVSQRTRVGVYAFLLVFAVTGIAHLEMFPFSGFRLFAELRPAERESWQLRAVDSTGAETPIRLGELPIAYRNTTILLLDFDDLTSTERDEVCDAWATPLRESGTDVVGVRVYAVVDEVRPDDRPPRRTLAYACGGGP